MSIIDAKYREKLRGPKDWIGLVIEKNCSDPIMKTKKVKNEQGEVHEETVDTGKHNVNLDRLFALARENAIDVSKYEDQVDKPNAPGRLRMTIGNMLRAAAKKRHGLVINDEWVDAPKAFIGDQPKTHHPDGSKIRAKADVAEDAEAA